MIIVKKAQQEQDNGITLNTFTNSILRVFNPKAPSYFMQRLFKKTSHRVILKKTEKMYSIKHLQSHCGQTSSAQTPQNHATPARFTEPAHMRSIVRRVPTYERYGGGGASRASRSIDSRRRRLPLFLADSQRWKGQQTGQLFSGQIRSQTCSFRGDRKILGEVGTSWL